MGVSPETPVEQSDLAVDSISITEPHPLGGGRAAPAQSLQCRLRWEGADVEQQERMSVCVGVFDACPHTL